MRVVTENEEQKAFNEALCKNRRKTGDEIGEGLKPASNAILTWEAINWDVPVPSGQLRLLKDNNEHMYFHCSYGSVCRR